MGIAWLTQLLDRGLSWLQRYTKTDMVYLTYGSVWIMTRQLFVSFISFGMAIAFANLIPKETYGAYKYVLSVALLLGMTTVSGINTSLIRSVAQGFEGSFTRALWTRVRWGTLGALAALVATVYYEFQGNRILSIAFLIVACSLPFKSSFSVYQAYWQGKKRFDLFSKLTILQEFIATIPVFIVLFLSDNVILLLFTYFCSQTLASLAFFLYSRRRVENDKQDPDMARLGKHLSITGAFFAIANNAIDVVLWHLLGPVSVAVYAFAMRPPQELRRLFTEAFPIALPKFAQRTKEEIQRSLPHKIAKLYLLLVPTVAAYILLAPFVYRLLFPAYEEAIVYSQVFSLTILFAPLSLFGIVFQALGRAKEIYLLSILSPVLLILGLFIFVPRYGLMGTAFALLCELAIQSVVAVWLFKRM